MLKVILAIVVGLLGLSTWSASAAAQKRVALLIGNKDYKPGVGALVNPLNDTRVVGEALNVVGFEVLKPVHNARRADMLLAVHDFASKLKVAGDDAVGFLYYSGHGIASAGENYLIPVDVEEPSTRLLSVQGVRQSEVLAILRNEAPNAAHYVVLDACRNTLQGTRGGKGFVPVGQQSGVLVAFAAEPGKTASDTGQGSGPYAAALAYELIKPGQTDLIMFHRVRIAVIQKTGGDQVPWTEDGIQRAERLLFGGQIPAAPPAQPAPARLSEATQAWDRTKDTKSIQTLEAFISRYKDTYYADLARLRMEELKKQQIGIAAPPSGPSSPHGWLGIKVGSVDDQIASRLSLRSTNGAVVMEVAPGGPGAAAGLKVDDVVLEINGSDIGDARAFARAVAPFAPTAKLHIKIWRNGKVQVVSATLGVLPANRP